MGLGSFSHIFAAFSGDVVSTRDSDHCRMPSGRRRVRDSVLRSYCLLLAPASVALIRAGDVIPSWLLLTHCPVTVPVTHTVTPMYTA